MAAASTSGPVAAGAVSSTSASTAGTKGRAPAPMQLSRAPVSIPKKTDASTGKELHTVKMLVGNPAIELVECVLYVYIAPDAPQHVEQSPPTDNEPSAISASGAASRSGFDVKSPPPKPSAVAAAASAAAASSRVTNSLMSKSDASGGGDVKTIVSSNANVTPTKSITTAPPPPVTKHRLTPFKTAAHSHGLGVGWTGDADTDPTATATGAGSSLIDDDDDQQLQSSIAASSASAAAVIDDVKSTSGMVYVYDVPSHLSLSDFYSFVGAAVGSISHVAIGSTVLPAAPNTFTVLLQFRSVEAAYAFRRHFHLRRYNSFEEQRCKIGHVHSTEFFDKHSKLSFPPKDVARDCTVCLESIVPSKNAMITILCNHNFHFHCLTKWADSSCPLCRYMMQPTLTSECDVCRTCESLWICLICGHVGCGRYQAGHAVKHFEETGHTFSLDVTQQRVWDYVSDGYVHRLILNKKDNQPIEVAGGAADDTITDQQMMPAAAAAASATGPYGNGALRRGVGTSNNGTGGSGNRGGGGGGGGVGATSINPFEHYTSLKMEQILVEYNYLLSSQMEKQRAYYQQQLRTVELERRSERNTVAQSLADANDRFNSLNKRIATSTKRNAELKSRITQLNSTIASANSKTDALKQLNATLTTAQAARRSHIEAADTKLIAQKEDELKEKDKLIQQLEEELADLAAHVHVSSKIPKSLRQQIADGSAIVMSNDPTFTAAGSVDPNDHSSKAKLKRLKEKSKRRS